MSGHESKTLGDFRIVREIGSGGQGTVYEARQMSLRDRRCALKVLTVGTGLSAKAVTRFEREAEIAARLDHPNIVPIYGRGEEGGRYYFAMKYVEGATLADVIERLRQQQELASEREKMDAVDEELRRSETRTFVAGDQERLQGIAGFLREQQSGPSPAQDTASQALLDQIAEWQMDDEYFRRVADVIAQVADGLDHAHREGVIHRDVKPGNIMVGRDGAPVITDFGVATELGGRTLTLTGDVFGTPHYMSPEQITVVKVGLDRRTDVYSLGVTLYELLTLRKPFEGDTREKVYRQILMKEPRPPRKVHANVPRDLETIAQKAMEKDADRRYHSAADLADDLRRFLGNEPIWAKPPSLLDKAAKGLRRNKAAALGIAAGFFALLTVGVASHLRLKTAWQEAERQRKSALCEAYYANIALAQQKIRDAHIGDAERLLDACPKQLRAWEWGWLKRLCHLDFVTLRGHGSAVSSVAFSPDSQLIASGSWDKTVKIWDAASGREVLTLRGHRSFVNCVAFDPDGQRIASGSEDTTMKVWDVASGSELLTLRGHDGGIYCVSFDGGGEHIASGSGDRTVKLWDAASGRELLTLGRHGSAVDSVSFRPDGERIASSSGDRTVKVWDVASGSELLTLRGHGGGVYCVAFSPDGQRIASGSGDRTVKIWNAASGREVVTLRGQDSRACSVAFSPDGQRIVSGSVDGVVKAWDAVSGDETVAPRTHGTDVRCVAFSPDHQRIASGSGDGTVKIWDAASGRGARTLRGHSDWVYCVAFSPDGRRIASGSKDSTVKVWDAASGREIATLGGLVSAVGSVAFSPDSQHIAFGSRDGTVKVWDPASNRETVALRGHNGRVPSVAFSPYGQRIASGSWDRTVKVWDVANGCEALTLRGHGLAVNSVTFSPDGKRITSAGGDSTVKVWDTASGREARTLRGHSDWVCCVAFSPDGRRIASGSRDRTVKIWDAASGREVLTLRGHGSAVSSVAFSPDGQRIASGSWDKAVKVWDAATGREVLTLRGHSSDVRSVAFNPGGQSIASASEDMTVKVWDGTPGLSLTQSLAGARRGEARALFRLALIRERNHSDDEARELHQKAAAATDSVEEEWAGESQWRLDNMPWLQLWLPTYKRAASCFDSGQYEEGMVAYRNTEELSTDDQKRLAKELASRLIKHAREHESKRDYELAAQAYRAALELTPDRADVQSAAGHVLLELGVHEAAVRCYLKATELAPERGTHHGNLGWALYVAGRYDDAMAASLRALELDPKLAYVHANVGCLHVLTRDLDKAMPSYEKAFEFGLKEIDRTAIADLLDLLRKQPEIAEAYYALGFCYEKRGDATTARAHYEKYVHVAKEGRFVDRANAAILQFDAIERERLVRDHMALALRKAKQGDRTGAVADTKRTLALAPNSAASQTQASHVFFELGSYEMAANCLARAAELEPANAKTHNLLGVVLSYQRDRRAANEQYRRAIEADPECGAPRANLARSLQWEGQYQEALVHFKKLASPSRPDDRYGREAVVQTARLLQKLARPEEAVDRLEKWMERGRSANAARIELAAILSSVGRLQEAQRTLQPLMSLPNAGTKTLILTALCRQHRGEQEDALGILRRIPKIPVDSAADSAVADLLDLGIRLEGALGPLFKGEPALKAGFDVRLARGFALLAWRKAKGNDRRGAVEDAQRALTLAADSADVQSRAGLVFRELEMWEEAVRCMSRATELDPENAGWHGVLGRTLYLAGRFDEAMAASQRALALDAKDATLHVNVGLLHLLKRDLEKAMLMFDKSIELAPRQIERIPIARLHDLVRKHPEVVEGYYVLGFCYDREGYESAASKHYQKYVDAVKEGRSVEKAKKRIAELGGPTK